MEMHHQGPNKLAGRIDLKPEWSVAGQFPSLRRNHLPELLSRMGAAHGGSAGMSLAAMSVLTRSEAEDLVFLEARLLDERRFDAWLALYHEDVVF